MQPKFLLPLVVALAAWAQTLTDVLASQNHTLSTLIGLVQQQPELLRTLAGASDITVLAPSNEAFSKLLADPAVASAVQSTPSLVPALLAYHVLKGTFYASELTGLTAGDFVPTYLANNAPYSTVSGGQVVGVKGENGGVTVFSGNGASAKVTGTNFNFTGGTMHIIDTVLSIPPNLTVALAQGNLGSLAGAATRANLVQPLSGIQELTLFAPNNEAFAAVADVAAGLTIEQLTAVLGYHVLNGTAIYSSDITDGARVTTIQGSGVTLTIKGGSVFVNKAKVVKADVLVKNGVVHVIDGVLIPDGLSGTTPNPSTTRTTTGTARATETGSVVPAMGATFGKRAVWAAALLGGIVALVNCM
ncbi:beta-Ig-H3/Fasciclin [Magnaporthiopsis poae ATCC 64411]|uniref:Beta-Ig-H3/Fasciclin n=1 Tax=Magnaporthiopsis poae (strain ATCC 64411 / 73-15) TaxID=644358 RepID=A0A0C4EE14_MAGP6|nr:beta-Ig-H3/Fasciclin [Magnaporthiopsis poae ATCC 64411]